LKSTPGPNRKQHRPSSRPLTGPWRRTLVAVTAPSAPRKASDPHRRPVCRRSRDSPLGRSRTRPAPARRTRRRIPPAPVHRAAGPMRHSPACPACRARLQKEWARHERRNMRFRSRARRTDPRAPHPYRPLGTTLGRRHLTADGNTRSPNACRSIVARTRHNAATAPANLASSPAAPAAFTSHLRHRRLARRHRRTIPSRAGRSALLRWPQGIARHRRPQDPDARSLARNAPSPAARKVKPADIEPRAAARLH